MLDILTTLPHFFAFMIAFTSGFNVYAAVIVTATCASVFMYSTNSHATLDYTLALLWTVLDTWYLQESIVWNMIDFYLHYTMDKHWQWHLVSATKAGYIAWKICYI